MKTILRSIYLTNFLFLIVTCLSNCQADNYKTKVSDFRYYYGLNNQPTLIYKDKGCLGCLQILNELLQERVELALIINSMKHEKDLRLFFNKVADRIYIDKGDPNFPIGVNSDAIIYCSATGNDVVVPFSEFVEQLTCRSTDTYKFNESVLVPSFSKFNLLDIRQVQKNNHSYYLSGPLEQKNGIQQSAIIKVDSGECTVIYDLMSIDPNQPYPLGIGHFFIKSDLLYIISTEEFIVWDIVNNRLKSRQRLPLPEHHSTDIRSSSYYFDKNHIVVPIEYAYSRRDDTMLYHQTLYEYMIIDYNGKLIRYFGSMPEHLKMSKSYLFQKEMSIPVQGGLAYSFYGDTTVTYEKNVFTEDSSMSLPFTWEYVWPVTFDQSFDQRENANQYYLTAFDNVISLRSMTSDNQASLIIVDLKGRCKEHWDKTFKVIPVLQTNKSAIEFLFLNKGSIHLLEVERSS